MAVENWIVPVVGGAVVLLLLWLVVLWRRGASADRKKARALDSLDTVTAWTPEVTRILSMHERQAHTALTRGLPDHMVLAQVPLARFLKVPKRHSYGEWMNRVGHLNADLLVCNKASEVVAVIEIHSPRDSTRSRQRHERMARVLKAAGVRLIVWMEGSIPSPEAARAAVLPQEQRQEAAAAAAAPAMRPMPSTKPPLSTIPVAEAEEVGTDTGRLREPAPSTWFDDFDSGPTPLDRGNKG